MNKYVYVIDKNYSLYGQRGLVVSESSDSDYVSVKFSTNGKPVNFHKNCIQEETRMFWKTRENKIKSISTTLCDPTNVFLFEPNTVVEFESFAGKGLAVIVSVNWKDKTVNLRHFQSSNKLVFSVFMNHIRSVHKLDEPDCNDSDTSKSQEINKTYVLRWSTIYNTTQDRKFYSKESMIHFINSSLNPDTVDTINYDVTTTERFEIPIIEKSVTKIEKGFEI